MLRTESNCAIWQTGVLDLCLAWSPTEPVGITWVKGAAGPSCNPEPLPLAGSARIPLVEALLLGEGHCANQARTLGRTEFGQRLRFVGAEEFIEDHGSVLRVVQRDDHRGIVATTLFRCLGEPAFQTITSLTNQGNDTVVVESLAGLCIPVAVAEDDLILYRGTSSWAAENRWRREQLFADGLLVCTDTSEIPMTPSSRIQEVGASTWTTEGPLPAGVLEVPGSSSSLMWQVEAGGAPWRWEIEISSARPRVLALRASGPTNIDHAWDALLGPGETVSSTSTSVSISTRGLDGAVQAMTRHRRSLVSASDLSAETEPMALVFNDYMNTLNGDPTAERLFPLIDAAAKVGAEVFCIDAGWYNDGGDWWPSIGEWRPSTTRFGGPDGLRNVLDHIRHRGMRPGLWLEPESVGVRSPIASILPDDAFIRRHGIRVVENDRLMLDLTSPAARTHLDSSIDRVVEMGIEMVKLDQNVVPGLGTDHDGRFPGTGLAAHVAAYRDWLRGVRNRYPSLLVENCGSGALRQDPGQAMLAHLQSTSDQQNLILYPPIAAAAPMLLLPEASASWSYPQPGMRRGEALTTLLTGLSSRLYLSGHLDMMDDTELSLVHDTVQVFKADRGWIRRAVPFWPMGLPGWNDDVVALGYLGPFEDDEQSLRARITIWNRGARPCSVLLPLPTEFATHAGGASLQVAITIGMPGSAAVHDGDRNAILVDLPSGPTASLVNVVAS